MFLYKLNEILYLIFKNSKQTQHHQKSTLIVHVNFIHVQPHTNSVLEEYHHKYHMQNTISFNAVKIATLRSSSKGLRIQNSKTEKAKSFFFFFFVAFAKGWSTIFSYH